MDKILKDIIPNFNFAGKYIESQPLNCGNINDTYVLSFKENKQVIRYILQRINHHVFKRPDILMENISAITSHIRDKVILTGGDPMRETLNFIPTVKGIFVYLCSKGNYWRSYRYIDDVKSYQAVEDPIHFYNAGKAFGKFQKMLSDFFAEGLHEVIPDFHHTPKRFKELVEAIEKDLVGRVKSVKDEINYIKERQAEMSVIVDLIKNGEIPIRVTHNDTKLNNVLIDNKTGEGICVIDLDTVMPGSSLYDFGDAIRFGANTGKEDEEDLSKVSLDLELFEHFTKGFLELTRDFLAPLEIKHLVFSTKLITLELGMRFLADYINGDVYFKTRYKNHNLDRARVQLKLLADIEDKYEEMNKIVEKYSRVSNSILRVL